MRQINFKYFEIWKPKMWNTFCFLFKTDEITLYINNKQILNEPFKLKVKFVKFRIQTKY